MTAGAITALTFHKLKQITIKDSIYLHPVGGVHPLTFEDTPGYTLPASPLSGSPCNQWII